MDVWANAEKVAVASGLASAFLERQRNILLYPIGIVSVLIYVAICYKSGIYADMLINVFYFIMSIYGWWRWSQKADVTLHVPVTKNSFKENTLWILVTGILWVLLYGWLAFYTDSSIPIVDSFTTALSVVGMILMAERKIENWIYWIITDVVCIPMFYYKGLELTAFQFFVFCIIAISGYLSWRTQMNHSA